MKKALRACLLTIAHGIGHSRTHICWGASLAIMLSCRAEDEVRGVADEEQQKKKDPIRDTPSSSLASLVLLSSIFVSFIHFSVVFIVHAAWR
jgi:hypothetical protein